MTLERSHEKLRPALVRSSDLEPVEKPTDQAAKPTVGRDAHGHFANGNRIGAEARLTQTLRKACGGASEGDAGVVVTDAMQLLGGALKALYPGIEELPDLAPAPVRALFAVWARHQALHAFFTAKAEQAGLDTPRGLELLAVADRQSQRAERVLVTCHDLARVHAGKKRAPGSKQPSPIWAQEEETA